LSKTTFFVFVITFQTTASHPAKAETTMDSHILARLDVMEEQIKTLPSHHQSFVNEFILARHNPCQLPGWTFGNFRGDEDVGNQKPWT